MALEFPVGIGGGAGRGGDDVGDAAEALIKPNKRPALVFIFIFSENDLNCIIKWIAMGESIFKKFELLDAEGQKQLLDFLDFLLLKQKEKHSLEFNYQVYRDQILSIGNWTDQDVELIEKASTHFNQWQVQEW